MSKLSMPFWLLLVAFGLLVCAPRGMAIGPFMDEFEAKYVKDESTEAKDVEFATAVTEAQCALCHVGSDKKDRNRYGRALAELLDSGEDRENKKKIQAVLDQVAGMKSVADDADSPTFGQLIEQGKLPGGATE